MSEAIAAVVFDVDGVLVDSESVWDAARREVVARNGEDSSLASIAPFGLTFPRPLRRAPRHLGHGRALRCWRRGWRR